jgi:hypothetical protein
MLASGLALGACYTGLELDLGRPCSDDAGCPGGACEFGYCTEVVGDDGETGEGTGEEESGSGADAGSTSDTGTTGTTGDPDTGTSGTDTGTQTSGTDETTGTTTGTDEGTTDEGTTAAQECDPNDPNVEVPPGIGDQAGEPCCTELESCTGDDVMGQPPQAWHVGSILVCVDGFWVVDDTTCIESCMEGGNGYLGCFWDSEYSATKYLCGCQ